MEYFKVLVTGSRFWIIPKRPITDELNLLKKQHKQHLFIVHGAASGVDTVAKMWAYRNGVAHAEFPAMWPTFGKRAGVVRNVLMFDIINPNLVLAFHEDLEKSRGTKHCMAEAEKRGIEVKYFKLEK